MVAEEHEDEDKEHDARDGPHDLARRESPPAIGEVEACKHDKPPHAVEHGDDGQHDLVRPRREEAERYVCDGEDAHEAANEIEQFRGE